MEHLRARLTAASTLLAKLGDGDPRKKTLSAVQRNAVVELWVKFSNSLTAENRATVIEMVLGVPWHGDDAATLMDKLAAAEVAVVPGSALDVAGPKPRSRRGGQNFLSFPAFLTKTIWDQIQAPEANQHSILNAVLMILELLSLRNPCEATSKKIASFVALMSESPTKAAHKSPDARHTFHKYVKDMMRKRKRKLDAPVEYLTELPGDSCMLQTMSPVLYSIAYAKEPPSACMVDQAALLAYDASYGCRGDNPTVAALHCADSPSGSWNSLPVLSFAGGGRGGGGGGIGSNNLEMFATCVMQGLNNMAQSQKAMMEMMCGVANKNPAIENGGLNFGGSSGAMQGAMGGDANRLQALCDVTPKSNRRTQALLK